MENISPAQWISANARIMAALLSQGKLLYHQIPNYLAYTAKIGDLALRYSWQSVLLYDSEYRYRQTQHQFDWDKDSPPFGHYPLEGKGGGNPTHEPHWKENSCCLPKLQ